MVKIENRIPKDSLFFATSFYQNLNLMYNFGFKKEFTMRTVYKKDIAGFWKIKQLKQ